VDSERLGDILTRISIGDAGDQKMDTKQAREFIEKELTPLWPGWKPSGPEIDIWQNWLCGYDWQQAKEKLQLYYAQAGRQNSRPNAKDMFEACKKSPPPLQHTWPSRWTPEKLAHYKAVFEKYQALKARAQNKV